MILNRLTSKIYLNDNKSDSLLSIVFGKQCNCYSKLAYPILLKFLRNENEVTSDQSRLVVVDIIISLSL